MATPIARAETAHFALTVHVTATAERMPDLTAGLVRALRALDDDGRGLSVTVDETPSRPTVIPLKRPPLRLHSAARRVLWRGKEITLTRLEFDLLLFLASNHGRVHRRRTLMTEVWRTTYVSERTVDVHVRRLRGKIAPGTALIRTVRGVGYQFADPGMVTIDQDPH